MAVFVTYVTARPAFLPAASRQRRIAFVGFTQAEANARGAARAGETAYAGAVDDSADVGGWIVSSGAGAGAVSSVPAAPSAADARAAAWRARLHAAWTIYTDETAFGSRRSWWPSMRGGLQAQTPLIATDRWAFAQIALGDLIAGGAWGAAGRTVAQREAAVAHIETAISTLGETWYGVMLSHNQVAQWAAGSVDAAAAIYSDLIVDATLATRGADGAWRALAAAAIPAGLKPDSPTLR